MTWLALAIACGSPMPPATPSDGGAPDALLAEFNQATVELGLSVHWVSDANENGQPDPEEVALRGAWSAAEWSARTRDLTDIVARVRAQAEGDSPLEEVADEVERRRREASLSSLRSAESVVVAHDFSREPGKARAFVRAMAAAAEGVESLYRQQLGSGRYEDAIAAADPIDRAVFERNHGPWCSGRVTPGCSAIPGKVPARRVGWYPDDLQQSGLCETLADELQGPFTAVRRQDGELVALPYHQVWSGTEEVAAALALAAGALVEPRDRRLQAYLAAAAKGFVSDEWGPADEAWATLAVGDEHWYVRVGPDTVHDDPCGRKAAYQLILGVHDDEMAELVETLRPVLPTLEQRLAELAGPSYGGRLREPSPPEFVELVLLAGAGRPATGMMRGHSLPRTGAHARRRTLVFTGTGRERVSVATSRGRAEALLCDTSDWSDLAAPRQLGTALHELARGLGPDGSWEVDGQSLDGALGGPLAVLWGELHAQTASLALAAWLAAEGGLDESLVRQARVAELVRTIGQWATADPSSPDVYGELAAIQLGELEQAVTWHDDRLAANQSDVGCYVVDHDAFPGVVERHARGVLGASARHDRAHAEALRGRHVKRSQLRDEVAERWSRFPEVAVTWSLKL